MSPLVLALLLLLVALIGARLTFGTADLPLGAQIFAGTGIPFIFLGFALGPHLTNVLASDALQHLTPLLALGLGWIGLLFGLQLDREHLRQFPPGYLALAWLQAAVALGVAFLVAKLVVGPWSIHGVDSILLAAAATACVSTPTAIALISGRYRARGEVSRFLFYVASLDAAIGIVALELTHAANRSGVLAYGAALSVLEWFAISTLLGCFFGILFVSLTRVRPRSQEFVLFLIGLVLFAAGTAFYLSLSPLFVCMVTGVVIGNLSPLRRRAYVALSEWEQPIYIMALILAGALLRFDSWWIVPLVLLYVVGRLLAKWVGGLVPWRFAPTGFAVPAGFGLALTPQGGMSLAMAISFTMIYDPAQAGLATAVDIFFATVVIAVGISDLLGPFFVRSTLAQSGELDLGALRSGRAVEAVGNH